SDGSSSERVTREGRDKQLKKVRISMSEIVASAIETTTSLFQLKNHELRLDIPWANFDVDADPMRLSQVVVNLLINAARYTTPGGVISIKGFKDGRELVVQVQDNGVGLAAEDIARVWDQLPGVPQPAARSEVRSGLGLTYVKSVTELHGGRVSARSPGAGLGSTFEVRLPRAVLEAARPHAEP
ncbi:MAG TPA: HAMP domain-containing sensor histidine kinase, partial [Polyangiaceae bacterium]|nr:HAMP domain-containing sensor histidine kinase [Polyangiaceae bacterium]